MRFVIAALLLCGFAVFSIHVKNQLNQKESPLSAVKVGGNISDFSLEDSAGQTIKLSEVLPKNKVVLINFWASWCTPCRMEMPEFERIYTAKKSEGFTILAVAVDREAERPKLDAYLKNKPVSFPVLIDKDGAVSKQFGINALPTSILVASDGKVLQVFEGVEPYMEFMVENRLRAAKHE